MRFDKEITSLVLIGLSIVVTVLAAVTVGIIDGSSVINALAAPPSHGYEMLQTGDNSMAILGLAIGAGLVLGLAGIGAGLVRENLFSIKHHSLPSFRLSRFGSGCSRPAK